MGYFGERHLRWGSTAGFGGSGLCGLGGRPRPLVCNRARFPQRPRRAPTDCALLAATCTLPRAHICSELARGQTKNTCRIQQKRPPLGDCRWEAVAAPACTATGLPQSSTWCVCCVRPSQQNITAKLRAASIRARRRPTHPYAPLPSHAPSRPHAPPRPHHWRGDGRSSRCFLRAHCVYCFYRIIAKCYIFIIRNEKMKIKICHFPE